MKVCPTGTILRKGGGCIKNRGKPGKGPKLFVLKKGELGKFGYMNVVHKSMKERHIALMKSLRSKKETPLQLFRRLNALYILNRLTNPKVAGIFKKDRDWVGTMFLHV